MKPIEVEIPARTVAKVKKFMRDHNIPESELEDVVRRMIERRIDSADPSFWLENYVYPDRAAAERAVVKTRAITNHLKPFRVSFMEKGKKVTEQFRGAV